MQFDVILGVVAGIGIWRVVVLTTIFVALFINE